jgi:hypothetical protein
LFLLFYFVTKCSQNIFWFLIVWIFLMADLLQDDDAR